MVLYCIPEMCQNDDAVAYRRICNILEVLVFNIPEIACMMCTQSSLSHLVISTDLAKCNTITITVLINLLK